MPCSYLSYQHITWKKNLNFFNRPQTDISYDFKSVSHDKVVQKRVSFTASNFGNIYNLALLDVLENGEASDITETRNKDMKIVLATVVQIITDFLHHYPQNIVVFKGSDARRHRLYRVILSRELVEIEKAFNLFGSTNGLNNPEEFRDNQPYDYFIITKKISE